MLQREKGVDEMWDQGVETFLVFIFVFLEAIPFHGAQLIRQIDLHSS